MALIIEADMPEGCAYCFAYDDEYCLCRLEPSLDGHWRRDNHCPILGEIPNEHGRLVDVDALQAELEKHSYPSERGWYYAEVGQIIDEANGEGRWTR